MKNFSLLSIMFLTFLPAECAFVPDIGAATHVHDMQMIQQQKFRIEEINDFKEVKEEQERFKKRLEPSVEKPAANFSNKETEFVNENGEIKIKYEN